MLAFEPAFAWQLVKLNYAFKKGYPCVKSDLLPHSNFMWIGCSIITVERYNGVDSLCWVKVKPPVWSRGMFDTYETGIGLEEFTISTSKIVGLMEYDGTADDFFGKKWFPDEVEGFREMLTNSEVEDACFRHEQTLATDVEYRDFITLMEKA